MPRVTCFQHVENEGLGTLLPLLQSKEIKVQVLKPFKGDAIPDALGDGLIVLGGPMGVYEEKQYPWMTLELGSLRKALSNSLPILGVCLGAQMLAHAAGGQVYRGALPEIGWHPLALTPEGRHDPLFLDVPPEFSAFHWHNDTFTLPWNAVRLASSGYYPNQIFKINRNAYGFQCHLEITEDMAKSWMGSGARSFTPFGGPVRPERVLEDLPQNCETLRAYGEKIFYRFFSML